MVLVNPSFIISFLVRLLCSNNIEIIICWGISNLRYLLLLFKGVQCTILVFSYDYVFVYDGVNAAAGGRLLASFSGETVPAAPLYAASGHMYILLFSDTNYALGKCLV